MAKRTKKSQATKSQAIKSASQPADAVQMLKADHKEVRKLFDQFRSAADDDKGAIAGRLFAELDIHSKLEEELFYPAVEAKLESLGFESPGPGDSLGVSDSGDEDGESDEDIDQIDGMELDVEEEEAEADEESESEEVITAAYESHRTVNELIQQLRSLDPTSDDYYELFTELEEAVIEHVAEEEDAILPLAASQLDVQALGVEMQRRKDDLSSRSSLAA